MFDDDRVRLDAFKRIRLESKLACMPTVQQDWGLHQDRSKRPHLNRQPHLDEDEILRNSSLRSGNLSNNLVKNQDLDIGDYCATTFNGPWTIETSVTRLKTHFCPSGCGKSFTREADMQRHNRLHRPPTLWCDVQGCNKSFYRKDKLMDHYSRMHKKDLKLTSSMMQRRINTIDLLQDPGFRTGMRYEGN